MRLVGVKVISLVIALGLQATLPAQTARETSLTTVRLEPFDRFWRLTIPLLANPQYSITDSARSGSLVIAVDRASVVSDSLPFDPAVELRATPHSKEVHYFVEMPTRFRYDAFYFPPGRKLIVDFYPYYPFQNAGETLRLAEQALGAKDTTRAVALWKTAYLQDPTRSEPILALARVALTQKELNRARALFEWLSHSQDEGARLTAETYLQLIDDIEGVRRASFVATPMGSDSTTDHERGVTADSSNAQLVHATPDSLQQVTQTVSSTSKAPPKPVVVARRKVRNGLLGRTMQQLAAFPSVVFALMFFVPAAIGMMLWFVALRGKRKSSLAHGRVRRILRMLERNKVYRRHREALPGTSGSVGTERTRTLDLRSDEEANPYQDKARADSPSPNENRPWARKGRVTSAALHTSRQPAEEPAGARERRKQVEEAVRLKREILRMAMRGASVRQIARELEIGVGEVELALGLGRSSSAPHSNSDDTSRMDFGF